MLQLLMGRTLRRWYFIIIRVAEPLVTYMPAAAANLLSRTAWILRRPIVHERALGSVDMQADSAIAVGHTAKLPVRQRASCAKVCTR